MPQHVRDAVLEAIQRQGQSGAGSAWMALGGRLLVGAAAAAAAILAIVVAPPLLDRAGDGSGSGPNASPAFVWDAVLNFRESPIQLNPSPDGYGHPAVWSYLRGPAGSHDPSTFVRLPEFDPAARDAWFDRGYAGLAIGWVIGHDVLTVEPWGNGPTDAQTAIVAWRSPVDAAIDISGRVEVDATCGDGVDVWLDVNGRSLETFHLARGTRALSVRSRVTVGETVGVGVSPGSAGNDNCDATFLSLRITSP